MSELRDALEARGLDTKGTKPFLVDRLKEALAAEAGGGEGEGVAAPAADHVEETPVKV